MLYFLNWQRTLICIFVLMILIRRTVSQLPVSSCSLDFQSSSSWYNSSCIGGDWDGFLEKSCCPSGFNRYLFALGQRANKTGLIYLNAAEQRSCLAAMGNFEGNVFACGLEKLTSGGGGCSDFFVANVNDRLAVQLKSLAENCRLGGSDNEWDQSCGSCAQSWQDIGQAHSLNELAAKYLENVECKFALLVVLTSSRIDDVAYVQRLFKCLGESKIDLGPAGGQPPEAGPSDDPKPVADPPMKQGHTQNAKIGKDIWIPIVAIGVAALLLIVAITVSRSCQKNLPPVKNAFQDLHLNKSSCPQFPIKEVYSATKNLNAKNLIGEGTAGKVYKATLPNNQHVAIKHIINDGNVETVVREVMNLSHVRHQNLVALLGYCARQDECFLVYELCPNGNLSQWIFGKDKLLSWIQRLEIAVDSARGLWFLHTYSEGCIVHRDIKPTNILLGPNFEAKLSDFGLSKVIDLGETYASSEVRGTFGYVDPEYRSDRQVNSSGDVYSFGIVLLQILSGKRVVNMNMKRPVLLDKMAKSLTRGGSLTEFADPKLQGEYSTEAFILTFHLALSCTGLKQQRPSMEQVVSKLEQALDISTRAKASSSGLASSPLSTS